METNKLRKQLLKIKKRTIQALLYISEDSFDLAKSPFFNCFKIVVLFLQLEGYVFSEYESKPLYLSENIYLANYTQLSPLTFILLQIGNDILTQFFFYFIFCLHVIVYLTLIKMSLDPYISKPNYVKKTLNLFFINYQWMFITPFQEISVGVMVCGKTAFIKQNQFSPNCYAEKNKIFFIFGSIGTIFVSLSGFLISYFFRNYQFFEKTFSRQFSYTNVMRILLHQLVIILYYVNFPGIDYAKHIFQQLLAFSLIYDIIQYQPFGYSFEANFYSSAAFVHQYFLILVSVWIFAPGLNDKFLFYTLLLISPLLVILSSQFQRRDQIEICNTFQLSKYDNRAEKYLEEIYRTASESDTSIESKILFIQIINHHIQLCQDTECSCSLNMQNFFHNNQINYFKLNTWTAFIFEKCLKLALIHKDYEFYEHLALKYVTFLSKYKNNPVNAYAILQAIMNNQQSQNFQIKGKPIQQSSFYFLNIQSILQKRNRNQFENRATQSSEQLNALLKGHSAIENIGIVLQRQLLLLSTIKQKFWEDYYNNKITNFQVLLERLKQISIAIENTQNLIKMLRKKQDKKKNIFFDCVSILNLEILFKICSTNNIIEIVEIHNKITQILLLEQQELETFLNFHFQNQLGITLISSITQKKRGELWKPNQSQLKQFFQIDTIVTNLNQLMPQFIANIHNGIIENFIRKGHSSKLVQTNLVFGTHNHLMQPLQFTLGYFFPKFTTEYEFYQIAFLKKVDNNYRSGSSEKSNIGYIYFDIDLNVLGINDVIAEKLFDQTSIKDLSKIELCLIIPSLLEEILQQYGKEKEKIFSDNEIIAQKQLETFYVPLEIKKFYQINQVCSMKNRVSQLHDIQEDILKTFSFTEMKQYLINYTLYHKSLIYQNGNVVKSKDFYFMKLQFLDDSDINTEQKEKKNFQSCKAYKEDKIQHHLSVNESSMISQDIDNGIYELASQRSKSSSQSMLQQSNIFQNQLQNTRSKNILIFLNVLNYSFATYLLCIFLIISFIVLKKFSIGNYCVELQSQILRETSVFSNLINAINNEKLNDYSQNISLPIQYDQYSVTISNEDRQIISNELIDYLTEQLKKNIQNLDISAQIMIPLKFFNEQEKKLENQFISNLLVYRQVIFQSIQNYSQARNLKDLSIIITNFPVLRNLLNAQTIECFSQFNLKLKFTSDQTNQVMICLYGILFITFISQLMLINKLFQQRKLILKLFIRTDFQEAVQEAQKFNTVCNILRAQENIWMLKHIQQTLLALNLRGFTDVENQNGNSDRTKRTKILKQENIDNLKFKIAISHQMTNLLSLLFIIGITLITFIYIISFHIQIAYSSQSLDFYSEYSQTLQNFQHNYLSSYLNSQCLLLYKIYASNSEISQVIYNLNEDNSQLQKDLDELNSNEYSTILLDSKDSDSTNLLQLSNDETQLLFQGYFCQFMTAICNQPLRNIEKSEILLEYYNHSIHQLLLQQGQVFYQNSEVYQMSNSAEINESLQKIINQQDYFLNNFWGFDIIITRIAESIVSLTEMMANHIQIQGNQLFLFAVVIGIVYFFITSILLWLFSRYSIRQNFEIRQYLIQLPFQTVQKKNISQQLKIFD